MTLYRRGNVWWVAAMKDGRRVQQSTGTKSKKDAKRFADGLDLATRAPTFDAAVEFLRLYYADNVARRIDLGDAWEEYARTAKAVGKDRVAEKSWRMRRERVAAFVTWIRENRNAITTVEQVDGPAAAAYAEHLATMGKATKTRQNILGELSAVWTLLGKVSAGLGNPWKGLAPRDTDGARLDAFTDEQVRALLAAAKTVGHDWWLAVAIGATTGLRYGDIANLRWESVDLAEKVLRVMPQKTAAHGIGVAVPIVDAGILAELAARRESASLAEPGTFAADYVLPEHAALYGDRGRGAFNLLNFRAVMDAAGITGGRYTFHSLRHHFRTRLAAAGVPTETAMRLCGHTDTRTSARYDHDDHLAETRAAVTAAVGK